MRRRDLLVLLLVAVLLFTALQTCGGPAFQEVLRNPSFEEWRGGIPSGWRNVTDPEALLERSRDSVDGLYSVRLMNVRSYDVHIYQNVTVPVGCEAGMSFSIWCKIEYSEDIDINGIHSPTGLEVGFEGGDVDDDGFSEYLYFYFFVDDDVRPGDFTVLAGIYNTTRAVQIHKIALLHRLPCRGVWKRFQFNLSQVFKQTLGGYPRGEYKVMIWALRWGEPREGVGVTGLVDGMSLHACQVVAESGASLPAGLLVFAMILAKRGFGNHATTCLGHASYSISGR